jgi:lipopolysaccharide/colanic/teichoic acid biosynthesis glycosyltransferase
MARNFAPLLDQDHGIYLEEYFSELICMERKRTERSRNHLLLMLLDISKLIDHTDNKDDIKKITNALLASIRNIDAIGWFKRDAIIGITFREMRMGDGSSSEVRDQIMRRAYMNLRNSFDPNDIKNISVSFHSFPESDVSTVTNRPLDINLYPDMALESKSPSRVFSFFLKTIMDVLGGLIGLVIFLPLMLVIAILIKCTSKGPVFFKQTRVGLFGKHFEFLKFRSMYIGESHDIHKTFIKAFIGDQDPIDNAPYDKDEEKVYKIKDDPRVTPLGRLLRKTSLDELPQFINVLRGEMSLVGPRPPIPYEYEQYDAWHKARIVEFKPGITGLWQVEGRSSTTFNEMVRLDLKYIRQWSLWLDIKIILKTPHVVFSGKGAY